jgi:hypothetical protein
MLAVHVRKERIAKTGEAAGVIDRIIVETSNGKACQIENTY